MYRILLIEDSPEFHKIVSRALAGHEVKCVLNAEDGFYELRSSSYDLILLDIGLPKRDGYSVLTELQSEIGLSAIPVLCLTGKQEVTDKVTAFSLGADDYILKPFDPLELRARVEGRLTKSLIKKHATSVIKYDGIEVDQNTHRVSIFVDQKKEEVEVTQTEFKLLSCLIKNPDRVYSRDQLLVYAWGEDARVLDRVVDVHLCTLRKKLGNMGKQIKAVPGLGYKFSPSESLKKANNAQVHENTSSPGAMEASKTLLP